MAGHGAILGRPSAGGRLEWVTGGNGIELIQSPDQLWSQAQDHRSFPFVGVAHLMLPEARLDLPRLCPELPVGREQQQQIMPLPVPLTDLEHRLASRHVVATVAIDEDETPKAMPDKILHQAAKQVE